MTAQAEREAMLERQREGVAKAKSLGGYTSLCADRSAGDCRDHPDQEGRRQAVGNRQQAQYRKGERVSGAGRAAKR